MTIFTPWRDIAWRASDTRIPEAGLHVIPLAMCNRVPKSLRSTCIPRYMDLAGKDRSDAEQDQEIRTMLKADISTV
jgi:hypothetical protein